MDIVWCNEGLQFEAEQLVGQHVIWNYTVFLITDAGPILVTDTIYSHTLCSLTGGGDIEIPGADWSVSASSGVATSVSPILEWDFDPYAGGVSITGFLVVKWAPSTPAYYLCFGAMFDTAYEVPSAGGALGISMSIDSQGCPEPVLFAGRKRKRIVARKVEFQAIGDRTLNLTNAGPKKVEDFEVEDDSENESSEDGASATASASSPTASPIEWPPERHETPPPVIPPPEVRRRHRR